jgi:hypothetical protein
MFLCVFGAIFRPCESKMMCLDFGERPSFSKKMVNSSIIRTEQLRRSVKYAIITNFRGCRIAAVVGNASTNWTITAFGPKHA